MKEKREFRKKVLAKRSAEDPQIREESDRKILDSLLSLPEYEKAKTIFCYVSTADEIDTSVLIEKALSEGKRICVPLCISMGVMHTLEILGPGDLQSGKYDIPEPKPTCKRIPQEEIDLAIVPCVCVDKDGYRLGYGGGFYDRWMEKYHAPSVVLCRESLVADQVPRESHDRRAEVLITDAGVRRYPKKERIANDPGYAGETIAAFTESLSSKDPVPGGGGASALVAAIGISLGNMVGSLTTGKKKYAAVEADIVRLNKAAETLREELLSLIDRDGDAFAPLAKAYGLPSSTAEEAAKKETVMEAALYDACQVPIAIMKKTCEAIELLREYAEKGSALAISDAGVGIAFCRAALFSASLNVYINTKSMKNRDAAERFDKEADDLQSEYLPIADRIARSVQERLRS
jgi:5,10-methenyltetrahydrofolate synthetase